MKVSWNNKLLIYSLSFYFIILADKIFYDVLHEEGIILIKDLQSSSTIVNLFQNFAFLGSKKVKLYLFVFIYVLCNSYHSFLYILITYFTLFFTSTLKILYQDLRPFLEVNDILAFDCESGYGYPSNHVLTTIPSFLIFFDIIFVRLKLNEHKYGKLIDYSGHFLLGVFFFLLGVSRMVVGVHYLHQVAFGFVLGYLIYFIFTDFLGFQVNNYDFFIDTMFDKEKIQRYIYVYFLVYLYYLLSIFFIKENFDDVYLQNYIKKCGSKPMFSPFKKCFLSSAEYFAILGASIGIYIDNWLNKVKTREDFIFQNISYDGKNNNLIGNWNNTSWIKTTLRFLLGSIVIYINMLVLKYIPSIPDNLLYSYIFTSLIVALVSTLLFFGFSKLIFENINLSNPRKEKNNELEERLL